jgi:hypothetical protein
MNRTFFLALLCLPFLMMAQVDMCHHEKKFEDVFNVYESQIDSYFRKFAENLIDSSNRKFAEDQIKASVLLYRTKLQVTRSKCLEQLLRNDCNITEAKFVERAVGLLDLTFEYEFPGLDFKYYENVHKKVRKIK